MVTRTWKVYGASGHRQKESFNESRTYNWTKGDDVRVVDILNADKTGTHDYTIVSITRNTAEECADEFWGQIADGIFENCRVGSIVEVYQEFFQEGFIC